ncbi:MAG: DUF4340 domain-containing protein [Sulfuricella sp.]|nr:DUF4340 domain-containing protein [Sulfuricella sp.]
MKRRILLNLALAALVAALALFVWLKPKPAGPAEYRLSTLSAADIGRIAVEKPGQAPIVLEKHPSGWRLAQPFPARADGEAVARVLETLAATSAQRFPAADLGRFQLDRPLLRLSLGGQQFSFGTQNPLTGGVYVATGGNVFLIAPRHLAGALRLPADFASHAFLAEDERLAGFESDNLTLSQAQDGKWSSSPAHPEWSQDDLNRWADEWRHASSLITQPYDGTPPVAAFTLHLRGGKTLSGKILRREPELVLLREDENLQYHFPAEVGRRLLLPGIYNQAPGKSDP